MSRKNHVIFGIIMVLALAAVAVAAVFHWVNPSALIPAIVIIVVTVVAALATFFFVSIEPTEATPEGEELAEKQAKRRYIIIIVSVVIAIVLLFLGAAEVASLPVDTEPVETTTSTEVEEESTTLTDIPVDEEADEEVVTTSKKSATKGQQTQGQATTKGQQTRGQATTKGQQTQTQPQSDGSVGNWLDRFTGKGDEETTKATTAKPTTTQKPATTAKPTTTQKPATTAKPSTTKPAPTTTKHQHSVDEVINKVTDYERLNDTHHILVRYTGDGICSCGEVAEPGRTVRTKEEHSFDSNGKCSCGALRKTLVFQCLRKGKVVTGTQLSASATETVTIHLENATVEDLSYYWTDPDTGAKTTKGISFVDQGNGNWQVITTEELHENSASIYFNLAGETYTLTCMESYE